MARKRTSLVSDAVTYIRNKILSYELRPGYPISDNKIALEMSDKLDIVISRSPVREAFLILQSEGLVEVIDEKTCVAKITDRDVFEICQVRDAIEQQSVAIVMDNGGFSDKQKQQLIDLHNQLVEANNTKNPTYVYSLDDNFHMCIVNCTYNNRLIEIASRMCNQMKRVRWLNMVFPNRRQDANDEHENILSALLVNDKEKAIEFIHAHNYNNQCAFQHIFETDELRKTITNILVEN